LDWNVYFQGMRWDADSQTYSDRERNVTPTLDRSLEPDSVRAGTNLYPFVADNPVGYVDPLGTTPQLGAWSGINSDGNNYVADWLRDPKRGPGLNPTGPS